MDHKFAENLIRVPETEVVEIVPNAPRDISRKQRRALEAQIRRLQERKRDLDFKGEMLHKELARVIQSQK